MAALNGSFGGSKRGEWRHYLEQNKVVFTQTITSLIVKSTLNKKIFVFFFR
jgi:hypothetical protein